MIDTQSGAESMLSSGENINFYNLLRKDRFAFLLDDAVSSQTDFRLIILNEDTQQTSEVRFRYKIPKNTYIRLIGLNVYQGQRYWIAQTSSEILRLWEDGRVENFPLSSNYHKIRYFMGLLFSYEQDGMSILKDTGIGFETVKKIPKDREIFFWPFATIFPSGGKTVYGKTSKKVVKFDMETLETEDIADVKPNVYLSVWYYPPHGYYVNEEDFSRGERTFYRIENNRLNPIRKFNLEKSKAQPSNATQKPRWQEEFWINENGVVRRKGKKVQVFVWPDLKELEFKGF